MSKAGKFPRRCWLPWTGARAARRRRRERLFPRGLASHPAAFWQSRLSRRATRIRHPRRQALSRGLRARTRRHRAHLLRRRGHPLLFPARRRQKRHLPRSPRSQHETPTSVMTANRSRRCVILSRRAFQYLLPAGIPGRWVTRGVEEDRKSTRLNSSHLVISYAVFCLKKKKQPRTSSPVLAIACGAAAFSHM